MLIRLPDHELWSLFVESKVQVFVAFGSI